MTRKQYDTIAMSLLREYKRFYQDISPTRISPRAKTPGEYKWVTNQNIEARMAAAKITEHSANLPYLTDEQ